MVLDRVLSRSWLPCALLAVCASAPAAQDSFLDLEGEPGDYIAGGLHIVVTPLDAPFTVSSSPGRVSVDITGASLFWHLDFAAPSGDALAPGG